MNEKTIRHFSQKRGFIPRLWIRLREEEENESFQALLRLVNLEITAEEYL